MAASAILAFNRGRISKLALARTDFTRTQFSAEIQTNWVPRALGSMMLRPGFEYIGASRSNLKALPVPFVKANDDTAIIELTSGGLRVWVDDELVTRPSVTTAITNGTFNTDLTGWTDLDAGASVSVWAASMMSLTGTGTAEARRRQQITVTGANLNVRHALDIAVNRGPVMLRVGSTAGGDEYITETTLETGNHSLALTPTGDFYIDLFNFNEYAALVDSIVVASSGVMVLFTPWATDDLPFIRWDQSGDVLFLACDGIRQRRIERRAEDSWSVVEYKSNDGPFMVENVGAITLTPGATSGDTTLAASAALFRSTHLGALFKITHTGQLEDASLTGANQFSNPIRVVGTEGTRQFTVSVSGTWVGTITLQYSVAEPGDWVDAPSGTFTSNVLIGYDDTLDNQVIYYRIGFKSGAYTSGTASVSLSSSSGSTTGICRVTAYTSSTSVNIQVLEEFGDTTATSEWSESYWSEYRGFPTCVAFDGGRLWWAGQDRYWGSVSDAYDSFDDRIEGDSGPISRSIGAGPVDKIFWLVSGTRLLRGAAGAVAAIRSSSLDEPITPTNFNPRDISSQGAANIPAVKMDSGAVYVQQGGIRLFEAAYSGDTLDYNATDLSIHVPEIGEPSIVKIAAQRQPETRVHCIRSDGTAGILIYDPAEEIKCWIDIESPGADGEIEDVCVLPGTVEDYVYYFIKRTIGGSEVRYMEKWALESQCVGGGVNRQADSFVAYSGAPTNTATGLSHLEGEEVVVWAGGIDMGTDTVSGGQIMLDTAVTGYCIGLEYEATFKSTKLAYAVEGGVALTAKKRTNKVGIIATNIHPLGLEAGDSFDTLETMPGVEDGADINDDTVRDAYDEPPFPIGGTWSTDARLCMKATAPRPCTVLAAVLDMTTNQ